MFKKNFHHVPLDVSISADPLVVRRRDELHPDVLPIVLEAVVV
jgi:hypothetical protein